MADKDTREDDGTPGAVLSDGPRSEGGPVTRDPVTRPGDEVRPEAVREGSDPDASDPDVSDVEPSPADGAAADAPPATEEPVPSSDGVAPGTSDFDREPAAVPADDSVPAADAEPSEAQPTDAPDWHGAIAEALTEPDARPLDARGEDGASFTAAAEDLFRPPQVVEDPHLITLGRRLDPALRIPRPVPPDIEPRRAPAKAGEEPWWKTTPWKDHLRTGARYAAYAAGGYLALVLVLILLFRFVNPPGSSFMLGQFLTGTAIDRTWVPLESISRNLVRAVIVSEDGRFCEHSGIDTAAIKEAIERAARGTPRGASTISMQVTKNLFLWNAKGYVRKVIEIPLTLFMELIWPKRRILEVYLNIAEWGPGVFGAEAAAQTHFRKSAARLNAREAALLAAVLPNPVVRDAGSPGPRTSAKARVVQSRVKAYGAVATCAVSHAADSPASAATRPQTTIRKTPPPRPAAPQKAAPQADEWVPTLKFGPR